MDDSELRRLWRQHGNGSMAPERLTAFDDAASASDRATAVAAMAEDARLADLGRVVLALRGDAEQLAAGLARQQRGAQPRRFLRPAIGLALAASAALLAVLVLPRGEQPAAELAPTAEPAPLFAGSFEGAVPASSEAPAANARDQLFRADFDS